MVLQITQDAFDNTVKENMQEFDLSLTDAIKDTIKEYEAQGVDLSHIIVDLMAVNIDCEKLHEAVNALKSYTAGSSVDIQAIKPVLTCIQTECKRGLTYQVLAGKDGTYKIILDVLEKTGVPDESILECLKTLIALMTKQPDLLDEQGLKYIIKTLDETKNQEIITSLLKWVKECCVLHEYNRQHIFDAGILEHLKPLLNDAGSDLLCAVLGVLRALVLDDDIRVEFGRSHEHARAIASDTLCSITNLLEKFKNDAAVMNELLLTLSALLVRTEFCKKVDDAGALTIIQKALQEFSNNDKLVRQCFKVLKALAGNDECKTKIIKMGAAPVLVSTLNQNKQSAATASLGLACIASLTLRSTENSEALYIAGAPLVIIETMKIHPESESVQKNASWAIRNMVSRSRQQNKEFLRLDAEALLKTALLKYKNCEYDIKAALRDLECDVELKEEWTGKGGKLQTDATKAK